MLINYLFIAEYVSGVSNRVSPRIDSVITDKLEDLLKSLSDPLILDKCLEGDLYTHKWCGYKYIR